MINIVLVFLGVFFFFISTYSESILLQKAPFSLAGTCTHDTDTHCDTLKFWVSEISFGNASSLASRLIFKFFAFKTKQKQKRKNNHWYQVYRSSIVIDDDSKLPPEVCQWLITCLVFADTVPISCTCMYPSKSYSRKFLYLLSFSELWSCL